VTGTLVVIATDLVAVSDFKVHREHLQEVEDFDSGLVREGPQWDALIARIGAHRFPR
jgi:hypothetical protein